MIPAVFWYTDSFPQITLLIRVQLRSDMISPIAVTEVASPAFGNSPTLRYYANHGTLCQAAKLSSWVMFWNRFPGSDWEF